MEHLPKSFKAEYRSWQPLHDPPPLPPSSSDRCLYIQVDSSPSRFTVPEISFSLQAHERGAPKTSPTWEPSYKACTEETGFLDLPKEIRDMIYVEICADLRREGWRWQQTAPRNYDEEEDPDPELQWHDEYTHRHERERFTEQPERPATFSDCAAMRTCKQLHAEFAAHLYAIPIQIGRAVMGSNVLPFSRTYAPLVRNVLVPRGANGIVDPVWASFFQTTTSLGKMFPNMKTLRVNWSLGALHGGVRHNDAAYFVKVIRAAKRIAGPGLVLPASLEMVEIRAVRCGLQEWENDWIEVRNVVEKGLAEAVARLRAKPKKSKGGISRQVVG
ncbi:hypothetical protein IQ07DRAFT_588154 [Pyrenochaeta sp. DS3sAY3a]|nr:hypothetical protein IQ07DRAFT_588154 [Pyrenochaeta sp. DS3sAY3a]